MAMVRLVRQYLQNSSGLFLRDRSAMAAVEFALVLPVLILLVLGGSELGNFLHATRRVGVVANSIGQMLTRTTSGSVNYIDVSFARDSAMVLYPQVLAAAAAQGQAWTQLMSVSMSSVVMTATPTSCTSNCTYTAHVAWSGGPAPRSCSATLNSANDTAAPSATALPADSFGPGSLIVTDVAYTYAPIFGTAFLPTITIKRSSYIQPRYVAPTSYIKYSVITGDNGIASSCPGY